MVAVLACSPRSAELDAALKYPARAADFAQARKGDKDAMHALCYDFRYGGGGLPEDGVQARVWCGAAAERGVSSAQTLYAELFNEGLGGPLDIQAAARWYAAAAAQNHPHALFMLGTFYETGRGVPTNRRVADSLFDLARAQGFDVEAMRRGIPQPPPPPPRPAA